MGKCFLNLQITYDLLKEIFGKNIIDENSSEWRAWLIANRIKHVSEDIRDKKLTNTAMPLWLTSNGFSTSKTSVSFDEVCEQIRHLGKVADCLSNPAEAKNSLIELLNSDIN